MDGVANSTTTLNANPSSSALVATLNALSNQMARLDAKVDSIKSDIENISIACLILHREHHEIQSEIRSVRSQVLREIRGIQAMMVTADDQARLVLTRVRASMEREQEQATQREQAAEQAAQREQAAQEWL